MANRYISEEPFELFAAANSGKGFRSFYGEIFSNAKLQRRYLIKGGPGTGKSSFMKRVATCAQRRGHKVESYRCSSDHTSLDAIVLDGRIAIIDSTAPHALEPEIAGAQDEIVNLGVFWNSDLLGGKKDEIAALSDKKAAQYRGAYRYLEGALALDLRSKELIEPYIKREKMKRAIERLARNIPLGDGYSYRVGLRSSVGMKGEHKLDYYERAAKRIYAIEDYMGVGARFLLMLADELVNRRAKILVSYDPIDVSSPDAILIEDCGTAFLICSEEEVDSYGDKLVGRINAKRFLSLSALREPDGRRVRAEYRADRRMREALIVSACDCLSAAGDAHFELERIYGESMDFDSLGRFCESFSNMICDKLE
jgi:hypothetical protein